MRRAPRSLVLAALIAATACGDEALRPRVPGDPVATDEVVELDRWDGVRPSDDWALPTLPARDPGFEALFALDTVKTIRLHFTLEEWNALLRDFDRYPRNELTRRATLGISIGTSTASETVLEGVGVRMRGNAFSRERPESGGGEHDPSHGLKRTHLKIKLDETFDGDESVYGSPAIATSTASEGRSFGGVRSLSLKMNHDDPSYVREAAAYELFRRAGVEAPRAAFARLFITIGEEPEQYLGVYTMVEDLDQTWIRRRFGESSTLFKCLWQRFGPADLATPDTDGDLTRGRIGIEKTDPATPAEEVSWTDDSSYRPSYDLKTNKAHAAEAADALNGLITLLASRPNQQALRAAVDVEALLRAMVVNAFVGMSDDYWRNGNNYYLLQRPDDQRWMFIPYDYDRTFGISTTGPDEATSSFLHWGVGGNVSAAPLVSRALRSPQLAADHRRYVARLAGDDDALFRAGEVEGLFAELQALVRPHLFGYDGDDPYPFDADLTPLEAFAAARRVVAGREGE